ncbi:MAG TPA: zinc-dependent metalloprotease [Flavipsychrobacter sp.]|nr:zinc-dependent metalloprotease [Flavipsychrobacter sp.]
MKKALLVVFGVLVCYANTMAQGKCGIEKLNAIMTAKNPEFMETLKELRQQQMSRVEAYKKLNIAEKTTSTASAIPIIFHIVLNASQITQLGGVPGIEQRLDSQMVVINRDYNALNGDSYKIPSGFKPLYANVGIHFGFAKVTPDGKSCPGYEIITTTASGFNFSGDPGSGQAFSGVKHTSSGGVDQWDPTKYINVWVINTLDGGASSTILGMTISNLLAPEYGIPNDEIGVVLNYGAFGVQTAATQYYVANITLGRTLTHELGHYFEIWHVWGDDGGLCPWDVGGADDGIADTPPQANETYGCPSFPKYDVCDTTGNGIMFMNYMDYSDDDCMHLFTLDQAAVMQSNVQPGGESYSLTQHPEILAVEQVQPNNNFTISPNPTTGRLNVYFNSSTENLLSLNVVNTLGQCVRLIDTKDKTQSLYTIDLSEMSKGIYFVQCNFSGGTVTRKIVLQ